jgi:hypothetical protein
MRVDKADETWNVHLQHQTFGGWKVCRIDVPDPSRATRVAGPQTQPDTVTHRRPRARAARLLTAVRTPRPVPPVPPLPVRLALTQPGAGDATSPTPGPATS